MLARSSKLIVAVGSALVTISLLGAATRAPATNPAASRAAATAWHRAEVSRIQAHIAGAESLVAAGDLARWSPAQRVARARNLALLRVYRERGVFPRNLDFPVRREPYFVDDRGVLCAMAFLVAASGRHDIIERIRATRNNARIRELANDTALIAWLDEAGLTVAEAARIQPTYGGPPLGCGCVLVDRPALTSTEASVQVGGFVVSAVGVALNLPFGSAAPSRPWQSTVGVVAGLVGIGVGLGVPKISDNGTAATMGTVNIAAGALSVGLAIYHMLPHDVAKPAPSSPLIVTSSRDPEFTVAPMLGARSGLRVNVKF